MQVSIILGNGVEPDIQLISQIKNGIINKDLLPGDELPAIRNLAADLQIDSSIIEKSYTELMRDKILESKGFKKIVVHQDALENCQFDLNEWVKSKLIEIIQKFRSKGITNNDIKTTFDNVINLETKLGV